MELIDPEYQLKLTEEFIKEKGLTYELHVFIQKKLEEKADKQNKMSVGDLPFDFEGHYSRLCYECSGDNFNESGTFAHVLRDRLYYAVDPNTTDEYYKNVLENEKDKYVKVTEALTEEEIGVVHQKLMKFVNQENNTFDYHLTDKFGFTGRVPTDNEILEWLKSLYIEKDNVKAFKNEDFVMDF